MWVGDTHGNGRKSCFRLQVEEHMENVLSLSKLDLQSWEASKWAGVLHRSPIVHFWQILNYVILEIKV